MGYIFPGDTLRNWQVVDNHRFATLEESIKEAMWEYTWKIGIWGQEETLVAGEALLTLTNIPSQILTNLY